MTGQLTIAGLGPGPEGWVTPAARAAVDGADIILGYLPYVARLKLREGQTVEASDNREELGRAERALMLAAEGRRVVLVSGGDPGVFAMAAAVFEVLDRAPSFRAVDVRVEPGVTAMLAAAARLGAPLGHDFCAISLSDNLKPWSVIERRLRHAADGDFVIALYNPSSKARPEQIGTALGVLATCRDPETVVAFARAVGRADESIDIVQLRHAAQQVCDMRTLVIIGARATRLIARDGQLPWVYTPRSLPGDK